MFRRWCARQQTYHGEGRRRRAQACLDLLKLALWYSLPRKTWSSPEVPACTNHTTKWGTGKAGPHLTHSWSKISTSLIFRGDFAANNTHGTPKMELRYHKPTIFTIVSDRSENCTHVLAWVIIITVYGVICIHGTSNSLPHHLAIAVEYIESVTCRLIFRSSLQVALLFTAASFCGWITFVKGFSDARNRYIES